MEKTNNQEKENKNQQDLDYENELRIKEELEQIYREQKRRIRQLRVIIQSDHCSSWPAGVVIGLVCPSL